MPKSPETGRLPASEVASASFPGTPSAMGAAGKPGSEPRCLSWIARPPPAADAAPVDPLGAGGVLRGEPRRDAERRPFGGWGGSRRHHASASGGEPATHSVDTGCGLVQHLGSLAHQGCPYGSAFRLHQPTHGGAVTCPLTASARALTCSTRRKPSLSAWSKLPMASMLAFASEYNWAGTLAALSKVSVPL